MNSSWEQLNISKIILAMYVKPNTGNLFHTNRRSHGLVINDETGFKDYYFSDGKILHTKPGDLFYLPKGTNYEVKTQQTGGCYAINFEGNIADEPFVFSLRNSEKVIRNFAVAAEEWKKDAGLGRICAMRALYDAVYRMRQNEREYVSQNVADKIAAGVEMLDSRFTDSGLTMAEVAQKCGISQVYFRKIFQNRFGKNPKEYLIEKRMSYAKQLLSSGQFSVSEVAQMCGYTELCHFSREFASRCGISPREFGNGK